MLVTFLFSDIEGSTELLRRLGGEYPEVLARYEALVSEACERNGGTVVDSQGDSLFVAFPGGGGLNAAGEAQRALAKEVWPNRIALRVRMGVHTGEAEPVNGRYAGLAVHRAARIGSAAHGGQVLVSATTKELADDLESPHGFRDLGVFPLKDFEQSVRLFQLSLDGLPSDFPPPRTGEPKPEGSRRWLVLAGAALTVVVAAAVGFSLLRSDDPVGLDALSAPNSVGVIDPASNTVVDEIPVGVRPNAITTGEGGVWVVNAGDSTVSKIDPATRAVVKTIPVANVSDAVTAGEGGVWVLTSKPTLVNGNPFKLIEAIRLDPKEGVEIARVVVRDGPEVSLGEPGGIAVGLGSVWAGSLGGLAEIDPVTNMTRGVVPLDRTDDLAVTDTAVWNLVVLIGGTEGGAPSRLERVEPVARVVTSSTLIAEGVAVAAGAGAVWVVSRAGVLSRIDPATNTVVETIPVGAGASGVAADENGVWVANGGETTVMRIDPKTNKVVATIELGIRPDKIAVGEGAVWVTAY